MPTFSRFLSTFVPSATLALTAALLATVGRAQSAVFAAGGAIGNQPPESFAFTVADATQVGEVRAYLADRAAGRETRPLVATLRVAAGSDGTNRNYAATGAPEWAWRVVQVIGFTRYTWPQVEPAIYIPGRDGSPSTIADLLRPPSNPAASVWFGEAGLIALRNFPVQMELTPGRPNVITNVSNRGYVAAGERALICGFVVEGGTPRNVVIRGLGPSLRAFGVTDALVDPKLEVFRGTEKMAENDNWGTGSLNRPHPAISPPPSPFHLVPADAKEPALELSLPPGAYTAVLRGADGGYGVGLLEVYDLDTVRP
ncbi:MAG: hypothetical protein Q7S40_35170 [Opitutaceae bacterium]|nr:hypothetical protein [Opitutaceae bacterium]